MTTDAVQPRAAALCQWPVIWPEAFVAAKAAKFQGWPRLTIRSSRDRFAASADSCIFSLCRGRKAVRLNSGVSRMHTLKLQIAMLTGAVLAMASCASVPSPPPGSITPAQLKSVAGALAGREVLVHGYLTDDHENRSLWSTHQAAKDLRTSECVAVISELDLAPYRNKYIVMHGVFRVLPENVIMLNTCVPAVLEISTKTPPIVEAYGGG